MSISNITESDVDSIRMVTFVFVRCWSLFLMFLGTIGHSLNLYVFTRPKLRKNPCVRYFLAATISGMIVTYVVIPIRLLQLGYQIDLIGYSNVTCKILLFIVFWSKTQTSWFIALASIDRFLCSSRSTWIRSFSNIRISSIVILFTVLTCVIANSYILIQYKIQNQHSKIRCPSNQSRPVLLHPIWTLIGFSLGPPIIMLIFGWLTIRQVQRIMKKYHIRNLHTLSNGKEIKQKLERYQKRLQRSGSTDRQLIRMMLVQCIYFSSLSTPVAIYWLYFSIGTANTTHRYDIRQTAIAELCGQIVGFLSVTSACTTFCVFTLSSPLFRRKLKYLFHNY